MSTCTLYNQYKILQPQIHPLPGRRREVGRQRRRRRPLLFRLRRRVPLDRRQEHPRHPHRRGDALPQEGRQHRRGPRPLRAHHDLLLQRGQGQRLLQELQPGRDVLPRRQQLGKSQLWVSGEASSRLVSTLYTCSASLLLCT